MRDEEFFVLEVVKDSCYERRNWGVSTNGTKSGAKLETLDSKGFTEAVQRMSLRACATVGTRLSKPAQAVQMGSAQGSYGSCAATERVVQHPLVQFVGPLSEGAPKLVPDRLCSRA